MGLSDRQLKSLRARPSATGNRLSAALEIAGVTQEQLAAATGLTQGYVSNVVREKHHITVDNAHKFAEYFGCHIEDLFPAKEEVA